MLDVCVYVRNIYIENRGILKILQHKNMSPKIRTRNTKKKYLNLSGGC